MKEEMTTQKPTTYDMTNFTIREATECGKVLRKIGEGAGSMEEVASRAVRLLYDSLVDGQTGMPACSLVRFFKTDAYERLDDELQGFARNMLEKGTAMPDMKCLVLLATAGERPEWNQRSGSKGHKAIPLPSEQVIHQLPMVRNLIKQLGVSVNTVIKPDPKLLLDMEQETYNVFHVADAIGSPYVPAQREFVIPYGIRSVIGFGGLLPSGDLFVIIMFLKVPVPKEAADLFKNLSLNIKVAIMPFEKAVFA